EKGVKVIYGPGEVSRGYIANITSVSPFEVLPQDCDEDEVKDFSRVILLPGLPSDMETLFMTAVMPVLSALGPGRILTRMVKMCGVSEADAEAIALDVIDGNENPRIATYSGNGEVQFLITAEAEDEKECKKLIKPVVKELKGRFGANIFTSEPGVTLEQVIVDLLRSNELTLTTAESCTGGLVASRIVSVPGASEMFREGFITYSNKAKRKYLGVRKGTLLKHGAVSENCAREMAMGGCDTTKSDVCVAVTGIAGPDGGTPEKPVGLVYIAVCVRGSAAVRRFEFLGDRQRIRNAAAFNALVMLRECLLEYFAQVTFGNVKKRK
ncbi:MAG: nicotinamide-nucleotide amidohydrolase family protein, partial [Lachnospiraceae bacterium]|nr:nicotinamide-nucleotide amidohydrolase family protein [Lachnospiraceae bacterium]